MKLLILDVDGVMTDGTKMYGPDGQVFGKKFCDHDFTAIKKFQSNGWVVIWLSADKVVNEAVAASRQIHFYYSRSPNGTINKVYWYNSLVNEYKVDKKDVVYVGDDLLDVPVMEAVHANGGRVYCPANAVPQFDSWLSLNRLKVGGGQGAIMELYNIYYPNDMVPPVH